MPKDCKESSTFGRDSCWCKNVRPQNTNITNGIAKTQKKHKKSVYQMIRSQTQVCQTFHQENLIYLTTENIKAKDVAEGKIIVSAINRTRQTHRRATLIRLTKENIKSRVAIKIRSIGKRDRTLSNCAKN